MTVYLKTLPFRSLLRHSACFYPSLEAVKMPSSLSPAEIKYELAHIHESRAPNIVISSTICISLAITAVILRLLARRLSKVKILADDYMILFALVSRHRALFLKHPNPGDLDHSIR